MTYKRCACAHAYHKGKACPNDVIPNVIQPDPEQTLCLPCRNGRYCK